MKRFISRVKAIERRIPPKTRHVIAPIIIMPDSETFTVSFIIWPKQKGHRRQHSMRRSETYPISQLDEVLEKYDTIPHVPPLIRVLFISPDETEYEDKTA